ncbi:MAG: class I SAM-dependent methyltransferase [Candidatus Paceibacterota bacterium]
MEKYKDTFFVDKYVALWAYGYRNGIGVSEGLYRTINDLGFGYFNQYEKYKILDIGCGVGRTASDYARFFKNSEVTGIDPASLMIDMAKKINGTDQTISIDMRRVGLGVMDIQCYQVKNLCFEEVDLLGFSQRMPLETFDLVTAVNVIDRAEDVNMLFSIVFKILRPAGVFILSTPLNFSEDQQWTDFNSMESLVQLAEKAGFAVDIQFDQLMYKELLDARGATEEYPTVVMRIIKKI